MPRDETQYKVRVNAKFLIIEDFDEDGNVIVDQKKDIAGHSYNEVRERILKVGDVTYLPKWKIEKLGKSVEIVTVPVARTPVKKGGAEPEKELTVSDMIPEDEETDIEDVEEDDDDDPLEIDGEIERDPIEE